MKKSHRSLTIINQKDEDFGKERLKDYYENNLIPAEKKAYLTDLKSSTGPYVGVQSPNGEPHYFMDAASQIATLGLGFNPTVFYGAGHYLESWLNDPQGKEFLSIRKAMESFFARKMGKEKIYTSFCNSGAEANEIALGECYKKRVNPKANKVLAFKGSFHGRMLVTLASTWNPSKREPFEWQGFESVYVDHPVQKDSNLMREFPECWRDVWDQAPAIDFNLPSGSKSWDDPDEVLKSEIESLLEVRECLLKKEIFGIIIEPMQCEGGDNYSSDRFHTALILMARSFGVPVIHDEVQTGFHLGRTFFWHRQFELKDLNGDTLYPNYVTLAKKAQVGMVISHHHIHKAEEFSVASAIRGYFHGMSLDQSQKVILDYEKRTVKYLDKLVSKYSKYLANPRACGLSFGFDLKDPSKVAEVIGARFKYGLLYYPAGAHTLRFRLNLAFKQADLKFLFDQLDSICAEVFEGKEENLKAKVKTPDRQVDKLFDWQNLLIQLRRKFLAFDRLDLISVLGELTRIMDLPEDYDLKLIDESNFQKYKSKIIALEKRVYEPTRQTDIKEFEKVSNDENGIALAIQKGSKLVGITFAAPLSNFPMEKGVRRDPDFNNPKALYMLDTTVDPEAQGMGLGRDLKYALTLLAQFNNMEKISGRNRDRLAGPMLNINLSLGAYEKFYIPEDYLDYEDHRDVIYYGAPLKWNKPFLNLSNGINSPMGLRSLSREFMEEQLPVLVNKMTLGNFVNERFLGQVKSIFKLLPEALQHGYTSSGQSECVDKLAKTLWVKTKEERPVFKMLTFKGHFFGSGSFLSRSLSHPEDPFFPTKALPCPTRANQEELLEQVEEELKSGDYLGCWIEPILQNSFRFVSKEFLTSLKKLCESHNVTLVYNETASSLYRYNEDDFFAGSDESIRPHAGMCWLGGQAGIVYAEEDLWLEKPLMMISTWDGDEFHFANYFHMVEKIQKNRERFKKSQREFSSKLVEVLQCFQVKAFEIKNGVGYFSGSFPHSFSSHFTKKDGQYIVCPSWDGMEEFLIPGAF